jgi:hypothetical protein
MDIGLIVVIVLVVLALLVAVGILVARSRQRRQEQQRLEAAEHRHDAEIRTASAERREAEAAERAARAQHEQAQAREQAARARQDREVAQARHAAADRIDPDVDSRDRDDDRQAAGTGPQQHVDPAARTDSVHVDDHRHTRSGQAAVPGDAAPAGVGTPDDQGPGRHAQDHRVGPQSGTPHAQQDAPAGRASASSAHEDPWVDGRPWSRGLGAGGAGHGAPATGPGGSGAGHPGADAGRPDAGHPDRRDDRAEGSRDRGPDVAVPRRQRTRDDRVRYDAHHDREHAGPVRAIADRLLGRHR